MFKTKADKEKEQKKINRIKAAGGKISAVQSLHVSRTQSSASRPDSSSSKGSRSGGKGDENSAESVSPCILLLLHSSPGMCIHGVDLSTLFTASISNDAHTTLDPKRMPCGECSPDIQPHASSQRMKILMAKMNEIAPIEGETRLDTPVERTYSTASSESMAPSRIMSAERRGGGEGVGLGGGMHDDGVFQTPSAAPPAATSGAVFRSPSMGSTNAQAEAVSLREQLQEARSRIKDLGAWQRPIVLTFAYFASS